MRIQPSPRSRSLRRAPARSWLIACGVIGCGAFAAPPPQTPVTLPAGWLRTAGFGVSEQWPTRLENGGDMRWSAWRVEAGVIRPRPEGWTLGGGIQYIVQDFRFDAPPAFGGVEPWERVDALSISLFAAPRLPDPWTLRISPSVRMSHEFSADTHDAWAYGLVVSAQGRVHPTLQLGFVAGVFRDLERTRGFPLLAVDWRPTDSFRVTNPRPAGPAGPAGLEASWSIRPEWTLGLGASYYSDRFRLQDHPDREEDIGQWRGVPAWLRASWRKGPFQATLLAGYILSGELKTETEGGRTLIKEDADPAPFAALVISIPLHLRPPPRP